MADTCVKCGGKMEEGFVVDQTYGGVASPEWAGGFPERSIWTGVKMKGRERYAVATYRCGACGYLEAYARPARKKS